MNTGAVRGDHIWRASSSGGFCTLRCRGPTGIVVRMGVQVPPSWPGLTALSGASHHVRAARVCSGHQCGRVVMRCRGGAFDKGHPSRTRSGIPEEGRVEAADPPKPYVTVHRPD